MHFLLYHDKLKRNFLSVFPAIFKEKRLSVMSFCKYCGSQLADGQLCSCEKARAARQAAASQTASTPQFQQTAPNPQFQQAAPNPQLGQAKQAAAQAQTKVLNATKNVTPFLQSYFKNPVQAIRGVIEQDNLTMAITLTVIRALTMSLAIFGVLHSLCKFIQKTAMQSMGGFNLDNIGAGVKISAPILESLLYGILIAVIGMALFVLLLFVMVKIQKGTMSIRAIYEASACNGILTSLLLLLTFIFSLFSIQAALVFVALSLLSWVVFGILTAQIVCPNSNSGLFWFILFLGIAIIFGIGFKLIPALGLKAVGGISVSAYGQSLKLKDVMGSINLSNITEALDELMSLF